MYIISCYIVAAIIWILKYISADKLSLSKI
jgi:hypothetical protein